MHIDAKFDGESDFAIKRYLDPWSDCVTDGQSQNAHLTRTGYENGNCQLWLNQPVPARYYQVRKSLFQQKLKISLPSAH